MIGESPDPKLANTVHTRSSWDRWLGRLPFQSALYWLSEDSLRGPSEQPTDCVLTVSSTGLHPIRCVYSILIYIHLRQEILAINPASNSSQPKMFFFLMFWPERVTVGSTLSIKCVFVAGAFFPNIDSYCTNSGTPKKWPDNGKNNRWIIWRCISYWKWGSFHCHV